MDFIIEKDECFNKTIEEIDEGVQVMDIKPSNVFTANETLSFTQTAQLLDYAQSSITAQIKTLEQELGVHLLSGLASALFSQKRASVYSIMQKMLELDREMKKLYPTSRSKSY